MKKFLKKFMDNVWVKIVFSISIIISSVPSIIQDFQGPVNNGYAHYGLFIVGIMYLLESTLWIIDIWNSSEEN
mgnify:CR=1 FL=1|jgi:hypothetical protein